MTVVLRKADANVELDIQEDYWRNTCEGCGGDSRSVKGEPSELKGRRKGLEEISGCSEIPGKLQPGYWRVLKAVIH